MGLTILFGTLIALMLLRVPIAFSLALASFAYILFAGLPPVLLMHNMVNGMDSFPLLSIPFFILA